MKKVHDRTDGVDPAARCAIQQEQHASERGLVFSETTRLWPRAVIGARHDGYRELCGDLFVPSRDTTALRPAMVFLHGGCWRFGSPTQFYYLADRFAAELDMVSISVDYRMSEEAAFPGALQDGNCAVSWLREHAKEMHINPEKIAVCGGSAGGNLSSLMAVVGNEKPEYRSIYGNAEYSCAVNAAILLNGEFDMFELLEKGSLVEGMKQFFGGTVDEVPEAYQAASSILHLTKHCPPTLLLHGTKDYCVSYGQSVAFHARQKELGIHSELELYEDKPHAWFNFEPDRSRVADRIIQFLRESFSVG